MKNKVRNFMYSFAGGSIALGMFLVDAAVTLSKSSLVWIMVLGFVGYSFFNSAIASGKQAVACDNRTELETAKMELQAKQLEFEQASKEAELHERQMKIWEQEATSDRIRAIAAMCDGSGYFANGRVVCDLKNN